MEDKNLVLFGGEDFGLLICSHKDDTKIYSDRGERVRSKSEKIIADKLCKENIMYRYEYPLETPYSGVIYPDFTILDEERRRNIIYEHFGMMDDAEYACNAVAKIEMYLNSGYFWGDNLIFTMETHEKPLNSKIVRDLAKKYLI